MDKEIINLKKDLIRSRLLMQSAKAGRGYFTILREESAMKKKQQQLQKRREEERNKFQPAKILPEIHGDMLSSEPLFRQLCALHWLLEALTIDHTHHIMKPVITCFSTKDPGGSKSSIKKVNKDKSREQRWEHFITASKTMKFKLPVIRNTIHKPSWRGSTLSLSRTSGGSSPQSSMISVNPGSEEPQSLITQETSSKDIEDNESSSTKLDEEPLHVYLQKLLEMVREDARRTVTMENEIQRKAPSLLSMLTQHKSDSTLKEGQATHKSSEKSSTTSGESHTPTAQKKTKGHANHDIVQYKSGICGIMRAKFYSIAQEAGFCLQDKMEILSNLCLDSSIHLPPVKSSNQCGPHQEERSLQKFRSFGLVSNFQNDIAKMRQQISVVKGDAEETADHWYLDLLSKLPEDLKNYRPAKKILIKLQKFGENLDLSVRPHVLLKVLQDLRVWELCSPDVAVAIEFVREHIIHMPREDYITWLQSQISMAV